MTEYIQVTVKAKAEHEETISYLMFEAGAPGVAVDDPAVIKAHLLSKDWDASVFDGQQIETGRVTLSCTLPADAEGRAAAKAIEQGVAELPETVFSCEDLPDTDWLSKWKEGFDPRPIGDTFWLTPVWAKEQPAPKGKTTVVVEPGMAFGTGDHATTAMALDLLAKYAKEGDRLVDLGCGSGILAIAGKKLGCGEALAIDIDPVCSEAVAHHCRMNDLPAEAVTCRIGDILTDEPLRREIYSRKYDIVLANINAAIVQTLIPAVPELLKNDGVFICSGVVDMFDGDVMAKFAASPLKVVERRLENGWMAYAAMPDR